MKVRKFMSVTLALMASVAFSAPLYAGENGGGYGGGNSGTGIGIGYGGNGYGGQGGNGGSAYSGGSSSWSSSTAYGGSAVGYGGNASVVFQDTGKSAMWGAVGVIGGSLFESMKRPHKSAPVCVNCGVVTINFVQASDDRPVRVIRHQPTKGDPGYRTRPAKRKAYKAPCNASEDEDCDEKTMKD